MTQNRRTTKRVKQPIPVANLTQAQAQSLIDLLKGVLSEYAAWKKETNTIKETLWQNCNPDDSNTEKYFDALNRVKADIRISKVRFQKLIKIQKKLKAIAKNPQ